MDECRYAFLCIQDPYCIEFRLQDRFTGEQTFRFLDPVQVMTNKDILTILDDMERELKEVKDD